MGSRRSHAGTGGAIHGDFHCGEADILANYALPLHLDCDCSSCPSRPAKAKKTGMRSVQASVQGMQRFPDLGVRQFSRSASKGNRMVDTWIMPRKNLRTCSTLQGKSTEPASPSESNYRWGRWGLRDLDASADCRATLFRARASWDLTVPWGTPKSWAVSKIERPIKTRS